MKKTLMALAVGTAMLSASSGVLANCDPGEIVIKFSHVTNTDKHPKGIAASLLEKRVNSEMNGKACMQVFPNSTLYDDKKVLEAMLNGDVQLAAPSLSKFEKFTKKFRIFDLPFLFNDIDAVDTFQNSDAGQNLLNSMNRRGLKGLAYWHNGMKQMSANKPLINPMLHSTLEAVGHSRKYMVACRPALLMPSQTPGRISTARSSLKSRTASRKPITAFWTTWS